MKQPRNQIDKLLRDWARTKTSSPESRAIQRERVLRNIEADRQPARDPDGPLPRRGSRRAMWFVLGAATAACILGVGVWLGRTSVPEPPGDDRPLLARLDPEQLAKYAALAGELSRLFPGQLAWVAEEDGTVQLGIAPGEAAPDRPAGCPILVRVVVMARHAGGDWTTAWTADVITFEEQQAVVNAGDRKTRLDLWAHRLPDDNIAVDTTLVLPGMDEMAGETSVMSPEGEPVAILTIRENQQEYRVYQSVAQLARL